MERVSTLSIPSGNYQGYYWLSDSAKPCVVNGCLDGFHFGEKDNPFVVEAILFELNSQISYEVHFVDGLYHVIRNAVMAEDKNNAISYVSKWDDQIQLLIATRWSSKPDTLCCGMGVDSPAERVFLGFNYI